MWFWYPVCYHLAVSGGQLPVEVSYQVLLVVSLVRSGTDGDVAAVVVAAAVDELVGGVGVGSLGFVGEVGVVSVGDEGLTESLGLREIVGEEVERLVVGVLG